MRCMFVINVPGSLSYTTHLPWFWICSHAHARDKNAGTSGWMKAADDVWHEDCVSESRTGDWWCESSSRWEMGHHGHGHWPRTRAPSIDPIKATPLCLCPSLSLWLLSCQTVLILMRSATLSLPGSHLERLFVCITFCLTLPVCLPFSSPSDSVLSMVDCLWFIV